MTEIISVNFLKGGVGKTSLTTNIAPILANELNKKILIVDMDSQGNASIAFGLEPHLMENTLYDVFLKGVDAQDVIVEVNENIHILPSNSDSSFLELDILPNLKKYPDPFNLLSDAIKNIKEKYEYVIIDTPPAMGLVTGNVLAVADKVLIPFVPEVFSVQGLTRVIEGIENFKKQVNPSLKIEGVVGMMIDSRTTLHSQLLQESRKYCAENGIRMFETIIPRSIRFAAATAYSGLPATMSDSSNPIVSAYFELIEEMFEHGKRR